MNPLRRTRIKPKAKQHRESAPWRPQRIRLDAREMQELRHAVFSRENGLCEHCYKFVGLYTGHMHHRIHRSHGGSDSLENCQWLCPDCHDRAHGKGKRS